MDSPMSIEFLPSTCPHDCPSACALEVERLDEHTIGRVRGAANNDYTAGVICAKVSQYRERVHHPDRLMQPMKRSAAKGSGEFTPISWDEALDEIGYNFSRTAAQLGPETVWPYYFAGTMGLVQRDGINRLRHAMGYSNQDMTICTSLPWSGWRAGTGAGWGVDPREMAEADLIVVWGGNPVSTQVNVMTHISRARKKRGAKLVVIDPYRTPTAEVADIHLAPRPGTDGALACAVMHVLFTEDFADHDYMQKYTDVPEHLQQHLTTRTPSWAAEITGLSVDEITEFACLYGRTKRSYIRVGYGFSRSRNGAVNMHAVSCLPAVTGAWKHRGGGAMHSNADLYVPDMTLIMGLDVKDETIRALDMSQIGRVLTGDQESLLGGPPVTAMLMQNINPAEVCPETTRVLEGLARDDLFLCVHEQFMTATAKYADILLPATMFLEHEDIYKGGGHVYLQVARPVIEAPGECRSNHEVICALAERLGAEHPGFAMTAWELIDATLRANNYPGADEAAKQRWIDCTKSFDEMHFLSGFNHADSKFRFAPDWGSLGPIVDDLPSLPDHMAVIDESNAERPFRLVAATARRFLNTSFTEMPSSHDREVRPTALVHPEVCRRMGLEEGDRIRLGNKLASVVVHLRPFDGLQPDVVVVEGIWPNEAFEEGIGINALTSADRGAPAGGAVFHDTAVWLAAA